MKTPNMRDSLVAGTSYLGVEGVNSYGFTPTLDATIKVLLLLVAVVKPFHELIIYLKSLKKSSRELQD